MARGRSFSVVRTPALVRAYLSGQPFPSEQGTMEAIDVDRGDYIASIHRHVKRRIKELDPEYHWPRYHSFVQLIRHLAKLELVEHTGENETSDILVIQGDPDAGGLSPGDLRLDPARGFQQRYYWRLTPGSQGDPAWENPMAFIRAIYGIELVAGPIRQRRTRPVPPEEELERPVRRTRRTRRPAAPEGTPAPVSEGLQELHRQLEVRRQELLAQARSAAQSGQTMEIFESLEMDVSNFIEVQVRPLYRSFPLSTLLLDLGTLSGCIQAFARAESEGQRAVSLAACRRGAAVIASSLALPLPVPDFEPAAGPAPVLGSEEEEVEEEVDEEARQEAVAQIIARWSAVVDRVTGWKLPNATNATNLLDRFIQEMAEAHPEVQEDDLEFAISTAREALEDYKGIVRSDYDDSESYSEARSDAWQEFVDAFDIDFSDLGEG